MEPADNLQSPFLTDLGRQDVASPIELPRIQPVQKMRDRWIPTIEFAQYPDESFIPQRAQLLDA